MVFSRRPAVLKSCRFSRPCCRLEVPRRFPRPTRPGQEFTRPPTAAGRAQETLAQTSADNLLGLSPFQGARAGATAEDGQGFPTASNLGKKAFSEGETVLRSVGCETQRWGMRPNHAESS